MSFKEFYSVPGWVEGNEYLTESWIELKSTEELEDYLKSHKVSQKTKLAIQKEILSRKNQKKERKIEAPNFTAIAEYLESLNPKQKKYMEKLIDYSGWKYDQIKEFSDEETKFFQKIPGLPNREGQDIYRGLVYEDKSILNKKEINYNHPAHKFSSWSTVQKIAEGFSRVIKDSKKRKGNISVLLKSKVEKSTKYIDTYSILMALKYEVNRKKIDFVQKYNNIYPNEDEIIFVGDKVKSEVIYTRITE